MPVELSPDQFEERVFRFIPSQLIDSSDVDFGQFTLLLEVAVFQDVLVVVLEVCVGGGGLVGVMEGQQFLVEQQLHLVLLLGGIDVVAVVEHEHQVGRVGHDAAAAEFPLRVPGVVAGQERLVIFEVTHQGKQGLQGLCMPNLDDQR